MKKKYILMATLLFLLPSYTLASEKIIVTIKPLHSIVSGVMGKTGKAQLLLTNKQSPHDFRLKASQIKALNDADIVFYINTKFETFLKKGMANMPSNVRKSSILNAKNLTILDYRKGGIWGKHNHDDDHDDDKHDDDHHDDDKHDKHDDDHDEHSDFHLWNSLKNAEKIALFAAQELSLVYPKNKAIYTKNAARYIKKLQKLDKKIKKNLKGLQNKPFLVFHDAYQYFEHQYNLKAAGSVTFDPSEPLSLKRIKELRKEIKTKNVKCAFIEPQFSKKPVETITEGTNTKIGVLDPLGSSEKNGSALYFNVMIKMSQEFKKCLG